jgi:hypothetical protein
MMTVKTTPLSLSLSLSFSLSLLSRHIPPEHPLAVRTPNTKRMDIIAPSSAGLDTIIGCGQSKFTLPFCISSARNAGTDSQTFNMSIAADFEKVLNLPCLALYRPNPHTRGSAPSSSGTRPLNPTPPMKRSS